MTLMFPTVRGCFDKWIMSLPGGATSGTRREITAVQKPCYTTGYEYANTGRGTKRLEKANRIKAKRGNATTLIILRETPFVICCQHFIIHLRQHLSANETGCNAKKRKNAKTHHDRWLSLIV